MALGHKRWPRRTYRSGVAVTPSASWRDPIWNWAPTGGSASVQTRPDTARCACTATGMGSPARCSGRPRPRARENGPSPWRYETGDARGRATRSLRTPRSPTSRRSGSASSRARALRPRRPTAVGTPNFRPRGDRAQLHVTLVERRLAAGSAAGLLALVAALRNAGIRAADVTPRCRPSDQDECPPWRPGC